MSNVHKHEEKTFVDSQTDVLEKVSKFFRQKMSLSHGTWTPFLRIHAECSAIYSNGARHVVFRVLEQ